MYLLSKKTCHHLLSDSNKCDFKEADTEVKWTMFLVFTQESHATMLIYAFGQSAEQLQTCDQVQFTVGSLNDIFEITIGS